jgi:hypothetical protein
MTVGDGRRPCIIGPVERHWSRCPPTPPPSSARRGAPPTRGPRPATTPTRVGSVHCTSCSPGHAAGVACHSVARIHSTTPRRREPVGPREVTEGDQFIFSGAWTATPCPDTVPTVPRPGLVPCTARAAALGTLLESLVVAQRECIQPRRDGASRLARAKSLKEISSFFLAPGRRHR